MTSPQQLLAGGTSTSPRLGSGSGSSPICITSGPPYALMCSALMLCAPSRHDPPTSVVYDFYATSFRNFQPPVS